MKKILSLLLALCLLAGCLPMAASAAIVSYPVSGGSISFDVSNGEVTHIDSSVTTLKIPAEIHGVEVVSITVGSQNLTSISLPDSVTKIGKELLRSPNLTEINVDTNNPEFSSQDGVLFNKEKTRLLSCPLGKSGAYSIPKGVTSIRDSAFSNCYHLTSVVIPEGVKSIEPSTFEKCSKLTSIVIPEGVTSIGATAFWGCYDLTDVWLPLSLQTVGTWAFSGTNLKKVYYINGDKERWGKIVFADGNSALLGAPVFYTEDGDTDDDHTISYELRTGMGDVILTMQFPERWTDVSVSYSSDPSSKLYYFNWTFRDSNQAELFTLELCNLGGSWSEVLGKVTLYPGRPGYTLVCTKPSRSPYADHDTSAAAVAYMKMRKDIPAILGSIEPNPALKWDWWLSGKGFADVPQSAYYYDAVNWAVDNGITTGTDKTHFSPNQSCTRAQAVTFLWRAAGEPKPTGTAAGFKDVKAGSYYEKAVQWAVEQNITGGTGNGKFSPETVCSRAQIVTFLWRKEGSPETSGSAFSDVKAGEYYETAVKWAVANEITGGTGNGKFSPDARCARGQIVTFLYRYAN
ncbi:S-layer homology domain-containing protein [uncultured Neglectibacter sp.]|uniref:S-layer homology domain-containing protein n=1 Tax=uncultured Neglectibacter sp. TaxID=1924108 RepID=UPI0034DEA9E8